MDSKISYSSTGPRHCLAQTQPTGGPIMINGGCQCPQETSVQRFLHVLTMATSRVDMSQQWIASNFFFPFTLLNTHEAAQPYWFGNAQTSGHTSTGKIYIPVKPVEMLFILEYDLHLLLPPLLTSSPQLKTAEIKPHHQIKKETRSCPL